MNGAVANLGAGPAVIAFDVGGTSIKAAVLDDAGNFGTILRVPTPLPGPGTATAVVELLAEISTRFTLETGPDVRAAGLVVPGLVDEARGIAIHSENLLWRDVPFRADASTALGIPVAFGHDVRSAGLAEYRFGAAGAFDNVAIVVIGTGIAASLFVGGRPYAGGGAAGELGHVRVAEAPQCVCGGIGCLEAIASASAIARAYALATGVAGVTAADVVARAVQGEAAALAVWNVALDALAMGLSTLAKVLDPEAIVLGGGIAEAGAALFGPLEQRLADLMTLAPAPALIPARLGENAGLAGAALLARELVLSGAA